MILHYPLQAYVVEVSGHQVLVNIGSRERLVTGTIFNVIEERLLFTRENVFTLIPPFVIAQIHVVMIEPECQLQTY